MTSKKGIVRRRSGSADLPTLTSDLLSSLPIPLCVLDSSELEPGKLQSLRLPTQFSASLSMLDRQKMHYRNLGNSGLKVSRLGLAPGLSTSPLRNTATVNSSSVPNVNGSAGSLTSNLDDSAEQILTVAYEAGINYFDTFDIGQLGRTEIVLGKVIKKRKWRRSSYAVSIRVHRSGIAETEKGLSRKHVIESVQGSLERLGLHYVDIVFAHGRDPTTPIEEIVRAFSWVIEKGWAFYWGTCQWSQAEIMEAFSVARFLHLIPPLVDQSEYNFFQRQPVELVIPELLCSIGCGSVTWSALANGLLSNDALDSINSFNDFYQSNAESLAMLQQVNEVKTAYQSTRPLSLIEMPSYTYLSERERITELTVCRQKVKYLRPIAQQVGCSLPQLAIAWCLRTDFVQSCLISPSSVEQLREQMLALSVIDKLTPEVLAVIEKVLSNQPILSGPINSGVIPNNMQRRNSRSGNSTKIAKEAQNNRRRSVASGHRKSISSSPRLSISHGAGIRESVDYSSSYDRRPSHV
ncbi:Voltage-gated potassium channel subunit beta-3 [Hypsibius exemplaris]|uniref:Voltage-gated potassium channel subunit beta-3 n=1 Tax=Hypsibius exemplaris TaxID=2072580 RepID=A0A1W0WFJ2_HYPEX|nr:Voltage-gated potassium channel subunit beta-3 [Hypsibius exemplaris]